MEGKGARFIISAFSRYKDYKISDLTQSNRYSSVPNPNHFRAVLFSLGPGSAVGEKGEDPRPKTRLSFRDYEN